MINSTIDASVDLKSVAYAGWNTNGNTIGTVVANSILLSVFRKDTDVDVYNTREANAMFNTLRILEDVYYQSQHRQDLVSYVGRVDPADGECASNLTADLSFYSKYSFKLLQARFSDDMKASFALPDAWALNSIFYPWNRTFEIGLCMNSLSTSQIPDASCAM